MSRTVSKDWISLWYSAFRLVHWQIASGVFIMPAIFVGLPSTRDCSYRVGKSHLDPKFIVCISVQPKDGTCIPDGGMVRGVLGEGCLRIS